VEHYVDQDTLWKSVKSHRRRFAEMGIPYHHIHNLQIDNTKPLLKLLTSDERSNLEAKVNARRTGPDELIFECGVCTQGHIAHEYAFYLPDLILHLLNV
jgi:hypothetical protein